MMWQLSWISSLRNPKALHDGADCSPPFYAGELFHGLSDILGVMLLLAINHAFLLGRCTPHTSLGMLSLGLIKIPDTCCPIKMIVLAVPAKPWGALFHQPRDHAMWKRSCLLWKESISVCFLAFGRGSSLSVSSESAMSSRCGGLLPFSQARRMLHATKFVQKMEHVDVQQVLEWPFLKMGRPSVTSILGLLRGLDFRIHE
jgi:hypothetical protein